MYFEDFDTLPLAVFEETVYRIEHGYFGIARGRFPPQQFDLLLDFVRCLARLAQHRPRNRAVWHEFSTLMLQASSAARRIDAPTDSINGLAALSEWARAMFPVSTINFLKMFIMNSGYHRSTSLITLFRDMKKSCRLALWGHYELLSMCI